MAPPSSRGARLHRGLWPANRANIGDRLPVRDAERDCVKLPSLESVCEQQKRLLEAAQRDKCQKKLPVGAEALLEVSDLPSSESERPDLCVGGRT